MRAQVARRNFHLDGRGIKIGVISDSFDAFGDAKVDVASGDLPGKGNPLGYQKPVRVLQDLKSGSDEGRAMLQIITDIAPGAELLFHTADAANGITEQSFSKAVRALARAGADIIVDDVGFATTFFQDGLAAQTVTQVTNQGVAYFSAIGNDSNRSYESTFRPSTTFQFRGNTYEAHDFNSGDGIDLFQDVVLPGGSAIQPLLGWDQAVGKISSDLELFLVSNAQLPDSNETNVLAVSLTQFSGGVEQPLEQLFYEVSSSQTAYLVIARKVDPANPTTQIKWISTANNADNSVVYEYVNGSTTDTGSSTVYGQPNAKGAIAVGAVQVNKTPLFGVNPPVLDDFSSRGGTIILLDAQGNRLTIPEVRQKPEIVAPNGVATTFEPFKPFFGTSAAAPHAAAVAALLLQRAGGPKHLSPEKLVQILQQTAIAIDPAGNFRSGAGLIQADAAVFAAYKNEIPGTAGNDRLQGYSTADNMLGLDGRDRLDGRKGFDALFGGTGRDTLEGAQGNDYASGEAGNDSLLGGTGDDVLLGNQGQDRLTGGKGDDLLSGGANRNLLIGNQGQNTFVLSPSGMAVVQDFQVERDQLALSDNLRFQQLQQLQRGSDLILQWRGQPLARLIGVSESLSAADFTSISIQS